MPDFRRIYRPSMGARLTLAAGLSAALFASSAGAQERQTMQQRIAREKAEQAPRPSNGLGIIEGVVTDTLLRPLGAADVTVIGTSAKITTGDNGRFRMMQVPAGQYLLVVRRVGYSPTSGIIEVPESDTLRLTYTLARSSLMLDTMRIKERRVSMRMLEFEQRRNQGVGQFVTREEIERRGSLQTHDFLRYMRGVQVSTNTTAAFAGTQVFSRREGGGYDANQQQQYCPMQVLLDGIVLPKGFNLDLLPPPKQIAGIEVYSGAASIPPQFGGPDRRCGVVAVWTRDGY